MRAPFQSDMRSLDTIGVDMESLPTRNYGIYPYTFWRRVWEYVIYFLSMLCLWELPYEWFFDLPRPFLYILPALIIDVFFLVDIFVVMRTGILQYGVIKLDKASIRGSFKTWRLVVYWLSPWPYYLIGWFSMRVTNDSLLFNILVGLKALRFLRLYDAQQVIQGTLVYIGPISRMMTLFCHFFTIAHISACIFWYTGYKEIPYRSWLIECKIVSKPVPIQYFHTLYYVLTTILTIGYGDLHPCTFTELCVVIGIEAVGVFFYNFLVSTMVSIVADPSRNSFLSKYQRIYSAFRWRGVSHESMEELLKYYEYVWERDRDRADFYETASKLPEGLQKKLALALHVEVFTKVDALRGADEEALERVAMALRPRIFTPGDFLLKAGRVSNRMFFLTEGKIGVVGQNGMVISSLDGANGVVLGEASVLFGGEEQASAIAETYVEAFELMKEDFEEIAAAYPQIQNQLRRRSARRMGT
jgi:hyperpolarization activated cyclic nucleotide-gated potassium channel 2